MAVFLRGILGGAGLWIALGAASLIGAGWFLVDRELEQRSGRIEALVREKEGLQREVSEAGRANERMAAAVDRMQADLIAAAALMEDQAKAMASAQEAAGDRRRAATAKRGSHEDTVVSPIVRAWIDSVRRTAPPADAGDRPDLGGASAAGGVAPRLPPAIPAARR